MPPFLLSALAFPAVALRHGDILSAFVRRDLAARYEGSLLGKLWPLLHPLLLLGVYSLVFVKMMGVKAAAIGAEVRVDEGWATTFFMISGILPWVCTVEALNRCAPVVVENNNLIKKVAFPSELLPTYTTMVSFVQMLIGLALFVPLYAGVMLFAPATPAAENAAELVNLAWLPLVLLVHFVFVTGLGMLLAAVNVFLRDVSQVIPLATLIWMFLTPVFFTEELVAQAGKNLPWIVPAMKANPLYHLLALYRGCFHPERGTEFPLGALGVFSAIAAATFLLGHGCFQRWKGGFADEV